jgi:hypothetical protein
MNLPRKDMTAPMEKRISPTTKAWQACHKQLDGILPRIPCVFEQNILFIVYWSLEVSILMGSYYNRIIFSLRKFTNQSPLHPVSR